MDLRCSCGHKLAEYTDTEVRIMDKKCKKVTVLKVVDGKLVQIESGGIQITLPKGKYEVGYSGNTIEIE